MKFHSIAKPKADQGGKSNTHSSIKHEPCDHEELAGAYLQDSSGTAVRLLLQRFHGAKPESQIWQTLQSPGFN